MEDRRVVFDASPYMLFEASGDSEADQHSDAGALFEPESEENDAQSCSCGLLSAAGSVVIGDDDGGDFHDDPDASGDEEDDDRRRRCSDDDDEEDDEGVVDQCCRGRGKEISKKSQACEDPKNVREAGDKLFWEACLAP